MEGAMHVSMLWILHNLCLRISSPVTRGRALFELLDQFRPRFQTRLAPRANGQVLRAIGQEQAADVESELPNLVFRITSKVSFREAQGESIRP